MVNEKESIKCEAIFNEERTHRYLWKQIWNKDKPLACVIMLNPCTADCLTYDTTTYLCVNNIASLDKYGGVVIVNIYSKLTSKLNFRWDSDEELNGSDNDTYIRKSAAECDIVILAWGTGAIMNKRVQNRVKDILEQLKPFSKKFHVITDDRGHRGIHPLTPTVRNMWALKPFEASDIDPDSKPKAVKPEITSAKTKTDTEATDDTLIPSDDEDITADEAPTEQ